MELSDLAREFLRDHHGDLAYFDHRVPLDQRLGQAFFNSLHPNYAELIRGRSGLDPFYDDELIRPAIEYLLEQERIWDEAQARQQANNND